IQTGINEPRYVSIAGVRKAARKELKVFDLEGMGLKAEEVGEAGSKARLKRLFPPPITKEIEMLPSEPEEAASKLIQILKEKGGLI
ncbi:MAG: electron transfer flavoprotein subunit beta, partial [Chloroflexi bacterium]